MHRIAHGVHLVQPDAVRIEPVGHILPLHIHGERLVQPHVERGRHGHIAAALVVLELVDDHGMGVEQAPVAGEPVDQGRVRDNGGVAHVFHAAEVALLHGDRAVGVPRIDILLRAALPQHGVLEDRHRPSRARQPAGGNQVFQFHAPPVRIHGLVLQHVPGARATDEQIRGHGNGVFVGDDLPARFARFRLGFAARIAGFADVAVGNQVRIPRIRFDRGRERALGRAVVEHRRNPLEAPLLALGHVLLGTARRRGVLVNPLEKLVRRHTYGARAHGQDRTRLIARAERHLQFPLLGSHREGQRPFRAVAIHQGHPEHLQIAGVQHQPVEGFAHRHAQAVGDIHPAVAKIDVKGHML